MRNIVFQQGRVAPRFCNEQRSHINDIFPNRWIGLRGTVEWRPGSPDITPVAFFLDLRSKRSIQYHCRLRWQTWRYI